MKVLCTGSNGFIGRHVMTALKLAGHEVIGLDVVPTTSHEMIWADITRPLSQLDGLDAVVHLAAVASPRECDNDPTKAFTVNIAGTHHVLKMALESGARKVVFASSAHVYGISPRYLPTPESHPLWLQNTYTLTKILGEQLCQLYWENHGLSYTTLRLFNAYGPGQALGYYVPDMISRARTGQINLNGGNTTKDWVYIDDVVRAFALAVESPYVGNINIGTGQETRLDAIARYIAREIGATFTSTDSADATRMCSDSSRAERVLKWKPTRGIWDALKALLQTEKVVRWAGTGLTDFATEVSRVHT